MPILPPVVRVRGDRVAAGRPAHPAKLRDEIVSLLAAIDDAELITKVDAALKKAGDDAAALARVKDRLTAKLAQKEG